MKIVVWKKVPFENEKGEFSRTCEFFDDDPKNLRKNMAFLKREYQKVSPQPLVDADWRKMQNTDSWKTTTLEKVTNAIKANNEPRDVQNIVTELSSGSARSPIAIRLDDGTLYLVGGNTRLMVCRAIKVKPNIVIIPTDW